ncbi:MAG: VWA domain-containing protein, partial [Elusimicrobia bacterium]|nr:VWA domain-containing protein [Elusimicrobiota bacterium]
MIFSAPALLWALPLAAAPLAFHLIFRRRAKRVPFSDTALLRRAYSRTKPLSRLRQWILVVLRCLILLLLILACAGPVLESSGVGGAGSHGVDLLLLLDRSYSMRCREGGKTRFEQARRLAGDILTQLSPADRAAVEFFSGKPEMPGGALSWMSPEQAQAVVRKARPGYGTTDYASALLAAQSFLQKDRGGRRRAALILSDDARSGFSGAPPKLDASILWLGLSWPKAANFFISSVKAAPGLAGAGPSLTATASGFGPESRDSMEAYLGGRRLPDAALRGSGPVRRAQEILPAAPGSSAGAWSGRLALRPDALEADDEYFYSLRAPARPRVLV